MGDVDGELILAIAVVSEVRIAVELLDKRVSLLEVEVISRGHQVEMDEVLEEPSVLEDLLVDEILVDDDALGVELAEACEKLDQLILRLGGLVGSVLVGLGGQSLKLLGDEMDQGLPDPLPRLLLHQSPMVAVVVVVKTPMDPFPLPQTKEVSSTRPLPLTTVLILHPIELLLELLLHVQKVVLVEVELLGPPRQRLGGVEQEQQLLIIIEESLHTGPGP